MILYAEIYGVPHCISRDVILLLCSNLLIIKQNMHYNTLVTVLKLYTGHIVSTDSHESPEEMW